MTVETRNSIRELILAYQEFNLPNVDELEELPSALEFMRYVAQNRPFVIRKGAGEWKACKEWDVSYLLSVMGDQKVQVALTPLGNADSPLMTEDGMIFVKPYEAEEAFHKVLTAVQAREMEKSLADIKGPVCYAQTQNDNLRNEYGSLFTDVPTSIPFARIALQKEPDAINFWMGNSHSTTALHRDPYENVYVQVLGQKHFTLLPPVEAPCVNEKSLPAATYAPVDRSLQCEQGSDELNVLLEPKLDEPSSSIPFATWDPDYPDLRATQFSPLSRPYRVTLEPGDMLYLPALWYHKVKQTCSKHGICVAVNYW